MNRTLTLDSAGFTASSTSTVRVDWCSVEQIVAYKVDLFSIDLMCLRLMLSPTGSEVEIRENDRGWQTVVDAIARRFEFSETWWSRVAFPAFEGNVTVLWEQKT